MHGEGEIHPQSSAEAYQWLILHAGPGAGLKRHLKQSSVGCLERRWPVKP